MVNPSNSSSAGSPHGAGSRRPRPNPGQKLSDGVRWGITHPWPFVLLVGLVLFVLWAIGTRSQPHHVRAVFTEAPGLYSGEDVQVNGIDVGKIAGINYSDGKAIVGIGINDENFWPLHVGTQVTTRYGTTVGNGTRYIQLDPGPTSAPPIAENGLIPEQYTHSAVEFDQVFNTFNPQTRKAFQGALDATGAVVKNRPAQIGSGIDQSGPALGSLAGFTGQLAADKVALSSVVANGDKVTAALASKEASIENLVSGAGQTFNAFGTNSAGIESSLDHFNPALVQMRQTLGRLDTSLGHLNNLMIDLRPGAEKLVPLSNVLKPALDDLRTTIPVADQTFDTTIKAAPTITTFLRTAETFSTPTHQALNSLAPMVECIRPYAPEIAGLMATWSSFTAPYDGTSHIGRLMPMASATSLTSSPETPAAFMSLFGGAGGATYALVRPPGYNAGDPQYMPQCDYTQNFLNPADDPEVNVK